MSETNIDQNMDEIEEEMEAESKDSNQSAKFLPNEAQLSEIQKLIIHCDIEQLNTFITENDLDVANFIMPNDQKQNLLYYAIEKVKNQSNCLKVIKELVTKHGLKGNHIDDNQQTILFHACREGHQPVIEFLIEDCKCDVNLIDCHKQTPIYYACRENRVLTVSKLLELNADISNLDYQKQTCLYYAAQKGNLEVVKILFDHGSDINHKDSKGQSVIQIAQRYKRTEVVEFLEANGAEIPVTWKSRAKDKRKKKTK